MTTNPLQSSPTAISDDGASGPGVSGGRVSLDAVCAVCLDQFVAGESIAVLPECGHKFHGKCLADWLEESNSCPMCRTVAVPGAEDDNDHDDADDDDGPAWRRMLFPVGSVCILVTWLASGIGSSETRSPSETGLTAHPRSSLILLVLLVLAAFTIGMACYALREIWRCCRSYIRTDVERTVAVERSVAEFLAGQGFANPPTEGVCAALAAHGTPRSEWLSVLSGMPSETLRQFVASVVAEQRQDGPEPTAVSPPVAATEPADDASASVA